MARFINPRKGSKQSDFCDRQGVSFIAHKGYEPPLKTGPALQSPGPATVFLQVVVVVADSDQKLNVWTSALRSVDLPAQRASSICPTQENHVGGREKEIGELGTGWGREGGEGRGGEGWVEPGTEDDLLTV